MAHLGRKLLFIIIIIFLNIFFAMALIGHTHFFIIFIFYYGTHRPYSFFYFFIFYYGTHRPYSFISFFYFIFFVV